jgi:hypothetical protein
MASSGTLCRVTLVRIDVWEELSASFITLIKEALSSSETSVLTRATRRNTHKTPFFTEVPSSTSLYALKMETI